MYRVVLGKFAVVYASACSSNIFKFLKSRNLKSASFSPLRNLLTRLHSKFVQKLWKNYKNITFQGRPAANFTLIKQSSVSVEELSADSCPTKIDVHKTNICPGSKASRANMLVLRTSNFQGATIRKIVPRQKHSIAFIVHH